MNPLFILFGIYRFFLNFNKAIPGIGWQNANKKLLQDLGIHVRFEGVSLPKKGAVLVFANHPTGFDPYIISSILNRDDVFVISDVYHTKKGEHVASHILPIYPFRFMPSRKRNLIAWIGYLIMRLTTGTLSTKDAKLKNAQTINAALTALSQRHVVMIFPSGGDNDMHRWRRGIGKLILDSRQKNISLTVFSYLIDGLSEPKLARHFLFGRRYFQRNIITIFGEKIKPTVYKQCDNASDITACLQKEFVYATNKRGKK